jgi:thioredoxin-related protein
MKKSFLIVFTFFISINSFAQDWQTNFEESKILASKSDINIVLVFQGSDWCGPCIKLDKQIWSTKEFQELASETFVMLQADFPRRKSNKLSKEQQEHNNMLAEKYNNQGFFPLVVVLDFNGKVLGKMGYEKLSPKEYFNKLTAF